MSSSHNFPSLHLTLPQLTPPRLYNPHLPPLRSLISPLSYTNLPLLHFPASNLSPHPIIILLSFGNPGALTQTFGVGCFEDLGSGDFLVSGGLGLVSNIFLLCQISQIFVMPDERKNLINTCQEGSMFYVTLTKPTKHVFPGTTLACLPRPFFTDTTPACLPACLNLDYTHPSTHSPLTN